MHPAITIDQSSSLEDAAKVMIRQEVNHLPVVNDEKQLIGIITSWDIAKAVACHHHELRDVVSRKVFTIKADEPVEAAASRMEEWNISALPVVDADQKVLGLIHGR